jgi:hypothetical protein
VSATAASRKPWLEGGAAASQHPRDPQQAPGARPAQVRQEIQACSGRCAPTAPSPAATDAWAAGSRPRSCPAVPSPGAFSVLMA